MRIGIQSAQLGRLADPRAVHAVARAAEDLGYSSVWAVDRLAAPATPPADGAAGSGGLTWGHRSLDPLAVLAAVASVTSRVRLGTSVLNGPWYRPVLLARALASLDVLSDGRLTVGLGLGSSAEDVGPEAVPLTERARRLDDLLDVLDTHWGGGAGPVGPDLRPVQSPRPPVLLAGVSPAALDRVARRADGWLPTGLSLADLTDGWARVRDLAAGHGRDPGGLQLVVRAAIEVTDDPVSGARPAYHGSLEQVAADLDATRRLGADEVILAVAGDRGLDECLGLCACLVELVGERRSARS